jgi:hypothetical protein
VDRQIQSPIENGSAFRQPPVGEPPADVTGALQIGPDHIGDKIRRIIRYNEWVDLIPDGLVDADEEPADKTPDAIGVRRT